MKRANPTPPPRPPTAKHSPCSAETADPKSGEIAKEETPRDNAKEETPHTHKKHAGSSPTKCETEHNTENAGPSSTIFDTKPYSALPMGRQPISPPRSDLQPDLQSGNSAVLLKRTTTKRSPRVAEITGKSLTKCDIKSHIASPVDYQMQPPHLQPNPDVAPYVHGTMHASDLDASAQKMDLKPHVVADTTPHLTCDDLTHGLDAQHLSPAQMTQCLQIVSKTVNTNARDMHGSADAQPFPGAHLAPGHFPAHDDPVDAWSHDVTPTPATQWHSYGSTAAVTPETRPRTKTQSPPRQHPSPGPGRGRGGRGCGWGGRAFAKPAMADNNTTFYLRVLVLLLLLPTWGAGY